MPIPVELLRFFDRGSGQVSQYAGEAPRGAVPEDNGEAEVAAAEAAIEHRTTENGQGAIAGEETLAIPPVAPIPEAAIDDPPLADLATPEIPPVAE